MSYRILLKLMKPEGNMLIYNPLFFITLLLFVQEWL